jgi:hypothetical protein
MFSILTVHAASAAPLPDIPGGDWIFDYELTAASSLPFELR